MGMLVVGIVPVLFLGDYHSHSTGSSAGLSIGIRVIGIGVTTDLRS